MGNKCAYHLQRGTTATSLPEKRTAAQVGLQGRDLFIVVLQAMASNPDHTSIRQTYQTVEKAMNDKVPQASVELSKQGEASVRNIVNTQLVNNGHVEKHPRGRGWVITDAGRRWLESNTVTADVKFQSTLHVVKADLEAKDYEDEHWEGGQKERFTSYYERNARLRAYAIALHGTKCVVCGFDFGKTYGKHGEGFIEVHHLRPVSTLKEKISVDPKRDMTVLCSNCHRMIHRHKDKVLSIDELASFLATRQ